MTRETRLRDVRRSDLPNVFLSIGQEPSSFRTPYLVIRGDRAPSLQDINNVLAPSGQQRAQRMMSVTAQVDRLLLRERLLAGGATFFALLAAALVCLGLHGVLYYAVTVRRREIGVRLAIGASPQSIRWLFLRRGLRLGAVGVAAGIPASVAAARALQTFMFQVDASDPRLLCAAVIFVLLAIIAAAYGPARVASRVDPATALGGTDQGSDEGSHGGLGRRFARRCERRFRFGNGPQSAAFSFEREHCVELEPPDRTHVRTSLRTPRANLRINLRPLQLAAEV